MTTVTELRTRTAGDDQSPAIHLDVVVSDSREIAIRATDPNGDVIGEATCAPEGKHAAFRVTVAPGSRGQGVGTLLLQRAIAEAAERGIAWLILDYPEASDDVRRFLADSGVTQARRVANGMVRTAILVTAAAAEAA